jgi:hypothetical protein
MLRPDYNLDLTFNRRFKVGRCYVLSRKQDDSVLSVLEWYLISTQPTNASFLPPLRFLGP